MCSFQKFFLHVVAMHEQAKPLRYSTFWSCVDGAIRLEASTCHLYNKQ